MSDVDNICNHPSYTNNTITGVEICTICLKSKDSIFFERIEAVEGAISELNDVLLTFSREMKIARLKFEAFVDMVLAYSKGAAEDVEAFKHLGEETTDDNQED